VIVAERDLEFNFTDAIEAIKFDDRDIHSLSHCMKAVDFVIEFDDAYLFVEVKDPSHSTATPHDVAKFKSKVTSGELSKDLVLKFRDSFLYRWGEDRLNKPVHYLSLITLEDALLNNLANHVRHNLPAAGPSKWLRQMVIGCNVVNLETWNRNFPKWPVRRLNSTAQDT